MTERTVRRVLATAGHVDHGKSTLVRALTGRDPDRLSEERTRGLTIELGFVWTRLPGGADIAVVDVPGHERFIGTMLAGLGPSPAVLFVVAADQGWQPQSSEHLAAVQALGIRDGLLVVTRADLADDGRRAAVSAEATARLTRAGLDLPAVTISATTGDGMDALRTALDDLVERLPVPDPSTPVRLWSDRSFVIKGAGTVVTGTLGAGTLHVGDRLTLLDHGAASEVVVRGLQSQDEPHEEIGPVARVAVNLRRTEDVGRSVVLLTPGAFERSSTVDVRLAPVGGDEVGELGHSPEGRPSDHGPAPSRGGEGWAQGRAPGTGSVPDHATAPVAGGRPPEQARLHVGSSDVAVHVRPLGPLDGGSGWVRLSTPVELPWRVGDRAILRDPGSRRLWALRVVDVDPLPLRRRGDARRRAEALGAGVARGPASAGGDSPPAGGTGSPPTEAGAVAAAIRLRSRSADRAEVLERLGLPAPTDGVRVGDWWVDPAMVPRWRTRLAEAVAAHHRDHPLSAGMPVAEAARALDLPDHLPSALGNELVHHLVGSARLGVTDGRVRDPDAGGLGAAEAAVATLEERLRSAPFAAPERGDLDELRLGSSEVAAAVRLGRLLRLEDGVLLLPDGPARAMRVLAALEQPFTLSQARQALGTTRRVAVPLLEHLDARGWTRRLDGRLREVVR